MRPSGPHHFDKGELNSLGREKLSLMIDDDDANNPLVIYLNVPADDEFKAARQDSIIAYLKEQGLEEKQVSFKEGANPANESPGTRAASTRLAKTETGLAGGCRRAAAPRPAVPTSLRWRRSECRRSRSTLEVIVNQAVSSGEETATC